MMLPHLSGLAVFLVMLACPSLVFAASTMRANDWDYHFFVVAGVLVADYSLQLSESMRRETPGFNRSLLELASEEYRE